MAASLLSSTRASSLFGGRCNGPQSALLRRASVAPLHVVASRGKLPNVGGGRKWKHVEVNENGNPVKVPMHIKKGDLVQVVAGDDKGKTGTVTRVLTTTGKVFVEGVNKHTKAIKPRSENEKGQLKEIELPIHHSNVMLYSKEKGVRSRVGHKLVEGKKVRFLVKTGELID